MINSALFLSYWWEQKVRKLARILFIQQLLILQTLWLCYFLCFLILVDLNVYFVYQLALVLLYSWFNEKEKKGTKLIDVEKWKQTSIYISALKEVNFNLLSLTRSVICDYHTKVEDILVKIICKSHGNDINFVR